MRKILLATCALVLLAGCGGRTANPTSAYKYGDEDLSCEELQYEMSKVERDTRARYAEWKGNSNSNVGVGVAGAILFWPALFAIDNGNAEEVEVNALRDRAETLTRIARKKNCSSRELREQMDAIESMRKDTVTSSESVKAPRPSPRQVINKQ